MLIYLCSLSIVQQRLASQVSGCCLKLFIFSSHHRQKLWIVYLSTAIHIILVKQLLQEQVMLIGCNTSRMEIV